MAGTHRIERSSPPAYLLVLAAMCYAGLILYAPIHTPKSTFVWHSLLPNLILVAAAGVWRLKSRSKASRCSAPYRCTRGLVGILLIAGLGIAMARLWPNRPSQRLDATALTVVLLVPIAEELFFRGMLLSYINAKTRNRLIQIASTALLFGAVHLPQGAVITLTMTLFGIILGWIAIATGSVVWPAIIHMGWNSLATIRSLAVGWERTIVVVTMAAACFCILGAARLIENIEAKSLLNGD